MSHAPVLATILPDEVEGTESWGAGHDGGLFPEEAEQVALAVPQRRIEHATVRRCARDGLRRLGIADQPILRGEGGAPRWPVGIVGSMTHCTGYTAAAVGRGERIAAIGIDAEPDAPLPPGVLDAVATPGEQHRLAELRWSDGPSWDRLLFSAKESVFKAWFPLVGQWLEHDDVDILLGPADDGFVAVLSCGGLVVDGRVVSRLQGRWTRHDGVILTAVVLRTTRPVRGRPA